jgi:hypothetical protein
MNQNIERLDNVAMHLLTENATLSRVIRHCRERQQEIMARMRHIDELLAKEREMQADQDKVATSTFTGQSDSQKTHAMAVSG